MLRADSHSDSFHERLCPSLIDLAAYAEDHLGEDEKNRIEAHVAGCETCLDLLGGIRAEVASMDSEARMLLVPSPVIHAAMALRTGDVLPRVMPLAPIRLVPSWVAYVRRGAAIAACTGLAFAGYHIGASFTATGDVTEAVAATSGDDTYAFGLLESDSDAEIDSSDLFAMAFADSISPLSISGETTP